MKKEIKLNELSDDEAEAEIEWIFEAKSEGYTWAQLAKKYGVSIPNLKKFCHYKVLSPYKP